jgi:hypothetical protein
VLIGAPRFPCTAVSDDPGITGGLGWFGAVGLERRPFHRGGRRHGTALRDATDSDRHGDHRFRDIGPGNGRFRLFGLAGQPGIALGNAYGSNIANIALILGITALISPIAVHSRIIRKELPILTAVTALAAWQLWGRRDHSR